MMWQLLAVQRTVHTFGLEFDLVLSQDPRHCVEARLDIAIPA